MSLPFLLLLAVAAGEPGLLALLTGGRSVSLAGAKMTADSHSRLNRAASYSANQLGEGRVCVRWCVVCIVQSASMCLCVLVVTCEEQSVLFATSGV